MGQLVFIPSSSGSGGDVSMQAAYDGGPAVDMTDVLGGYEFRWDGSEGPFFSVQTDDAALFSETIGYQIISDGGYYLNIAKDQIRWTQNPTSGEGPNVFIFAPADDEQSGTLTIRGYDFPTLSDVDLRGGGLELRAGDGTSAATSADGGDGGAVLIRSGNGGTGSGAGNSGGNAREILISGGIGGFGSDSADGGDGGDIELTGGAAGNAGGTPGRGGDAYLVSGGGEPGENAGDVYIGFGDAVRDGGFFLEATTGIVRMRKHTTSTGDLGSLALVNIFADQEAVLPPEDGLIHLRTNDGAGPALEKGFRAYRDDAYGLLGRIYQRTFVEADLASDKLNVTHSLDSRGTIIAVWDNNGLLRTSPTDYSVTEPTADTLQVDIDPGLTPITGTWRITVLGV